MVAVLLMTFQLIDKTPQIQKESLRYKLKTDNINLEKQDM